MNQERFKKLVCGQSKGTLIVVSRFLLNVMAAFYGLVIAFRNFLYSRGLLKSYSITQGGLITTDRTQATIPVICVGNITVGGTGKTPMVIWLCQWFRSKDINCVILTRGYKAAKGENDEPEILKKNCPGSAVIISPDRLKGAMEAVRRYRAQVLIMDDGFQHRRLHREIDIVMVDATEPFGFGKMLPAGLLREPITSLKRAQAAVITRSDQVSEDKSAEIIKNINPNIVIAKAVHQPVCAMAADKQIHIEQLKGRRVYAFCGIANPEAFLSTIKSLAAEVVGSKIYDDHHKYTAGDVGEIFDKAERAEAEFILTTEKDYNKIDLSATGKKGLVLAFVAVRMKLLSGEEQITQLIERSLAGKIPRKRNV